MSEFKAGNRIDVWHTARGKETPFFYRGDFVSEDKLFLIMDDRYKGRIMLKRTGIDKAELTKLQGNGENQK